MSDHQPLVPPRSKPFRIREYAAGFTGDAGKEDALAKIPGLRLRLNEIQDLLYADRRFALLVIFQGIDTAGKDGTVKSVFQEVGPLGCAVENFGVPNEEEAAHDYLWRYHRAAPERGKVVIFNRSYYESVLVERVHGFAPEARWKGRYDEINAFERLLAAEGTVIMKFFLHISKEEQRERLQERIDNPRKQWKYRPGDLDERKLWDNYQSAFEDMVDRCNSEIAPWHVIPANHKWYRDEVVARALIERLEQLDLRYPPAAEGIAGTKIS
jgi:PPK2 family polyphosphate:nucleotide phosphotransferase